MNISSTLKPLSIAVASAIPQSHALQKRKANQMSAAISLYSQPSEILQNILTSNELTDRENYLPFNDNPVKRVTKQAVSTPEKMKQEISKNMITNQRQRNQVAMQFLLRKKIPPAISLDTIREFRLTGDTNAKWKELISELRKLNREGLADKLEKYLMQRLTN